MTIVPRWEWRIFGDAFGGAEERLAAIGPDRVEESDELYLLSIDGDASVKVRDGLMDVKRLLHVDDGGLEQWVPAMKAPFPLGARDVRAVFTALGAVVPSLNRAGYTLEELLDELVGATPGLLPVAVRKRRERSTVDGCMAELTSVRAGAAATRTIAVEAEDPDRVRAVVEEMGLASRPVVCVARGLKALLGVGARRYAVVDIGTNSVKLHVGERVADGRWLDVADGARVTRLGEGVDASGRLGRAPMERTVEAIAGMVAQARGLGADDIAAVGTAGMRAASNAAELCAAVRERSGIDVEVISGEDEARLAYVATTAALPAAEGARVVFDTGGGSSQFTFGEGAQVVERFSLPVGAARYTERHGLDAAVSREVLDAALAEIARDLAAITHRPPPAAVAGMGGAVTNLAAVEHGLAAYDPAVVQGSTLDRAEIERQIELYRTRPAEERREIVGLQPDRAAVILAGACIVATVLRLLGRDSLVVSDRGLRHGVIRERFALRPPRPAPAMAGHVA